MRWLRIGIAVAVTVVWATGYLISYFDPSVRAPTGLLPLMLVVVGGLFGKEISDQIKERKR